MHRIALESLFSRRRWVPLPGYVLYRPASHLVFQISMIMLLCSCHSPQFICLALFIISKKGERSVLYKNHLTKHSTTVYHNWLAMYHITFCKKNPYLIGLNSWNKHGNFICYLFIRFPPPPASYKTENNIKKFLQKYFPRGHIEKAVQYLVYNIRYFSQGTNI